MEANAFQKKAAPEMRTKAHEHNADVDIRVLLIQ
jgi:hypothetical protein